VSRSRRTGRGFTTIELMVTVAIIAAILALAAINLNRVKPRSTFIATADEVQALVHAARLQAMATGHNVVVMLFPAYSPGAGRTGRFIVIEDQAASFFTAGATPNFGDYVPSVAAFGAPTSQQPTVFDLPAGVVIGPATGRPTGALPAPLATVAVNKACSFCGTTSARGAINFDDRGHATFFSGNGAELTVGSGASFTLSASELSSTRTLVVTSGTGAVLAYGDNSGAP
jgi:prepilin-type N-terminal cleavage/methylation domain-containing protein